MGSIDRWAKSQNAWRRTQDSRRERCHQAREKWDEAKVAATRDEAEKLIEEMRFILSVGERAIGHINLTEEMIRDLLNTKS
jgi:hypothetical protein